MSELSFTFLGTGTSQGVPVISCECHTCQSTDSRDKRLRTSLLFKINGKTVVIDTGPDFRQQMLQNEVKMVDAVLFTHDHKDHIAGMDDIRAYNFKTKKPMDIYASLDVQDSIRREFHYVFSNRQYPGIPQVTLHTIEGEPFKLFEEEIIPIQGLHYKLPVYAFRIRNFTYITDVNSFTDEEFKKIEGTEYLVINALRKEKHISHFNLEEALEFIAKIGPKKAFLTHVSHLMGRHEEVSKELPDNVYFAYDGLTIEAE